MRMIKDWNLVKSNVVSLSTAILMLLISSCTQSKEDAVTAKRPNILWIIAEDLSPDLKCYGNKSVATPNLDLLTADGIRFERAFTTAPVCAPSRTALAVGTYQTAINAHHMRYPDSLKNTLPEGVVPINEVFRRNGYQTALFKEAPANYKTDWSFETPYTHYDAKRWSELSSGKPFFAYLNLKLTHRPFERDTINPIDPTNVSIPPYYPDDQVVREDWAQYLESVQIMDRQVGEVLEAMNQHGFGDNTIIVFFGDHGRPMSRGKNNLYDSGMQIPLIFSIPSNSKWASDYIKGSTSKELVSAIDITASSLAFAGIEKPDWMEGRVLFGDDRDLERESVFCALDRIGESAFKSRAVRTHKWKYIKNYNTASSINELATAYRKAMHPIYHVLNIYDELGKLTPEQKALVLPMPKEELYDLEVDPYEINNLANRSEYNNELRMMQEKLETWQSNVTDYGMQEDSESLKKAFREYGIQSSNKYRNKIAALEKKVREAIDN